MGYEARKNAETKHLGKFNVKVFIRFKDGTQETILADSWEDTQLNIGLQYRIGLNNPALRIIPHDSIKDIEITLQDEQPSGIIV